ncbi:VCBS repeat-containing protein [Rhodobacteraceae bacterium KMM 6894]|nr:VCBS repeat-containing protein [Rhodobacteraceae bacterium KMM 6894]
MKLKFLVFLGVCLAVPAAIVLYDPRESLPESGAFDVIEDVNIYNVFDAGIADFNGDGDIDRWTVNHSAAQWIRLGGDTRPLSLNDIGLAGLYQNADLPGFEAGLGPVPALRPVRIYMREAHFIVQADAEMRQNSVKGWFDIPWRTAYKGFGGASVTKTPCATGPYCHRISFDVPKGGRVELLPVPPPSDGFPITITLDPTTDLSTVQLGSDAITPKSHVFTYHSKDRHSLAVATLQGAAEQVVFVSRGGARGLLPDVHPDAQDEFFKWTESGFKPGIAPPGIDKDGCPGRQAGWHDINGDGRLDLYQVCGRNGPDAANGRAKNRLYIQQTDGQFIEDAASYGLDFEGVGIFRFLPHANAEAPSMMLWITTGKIALFERAGPHFEQRWRIDTPLSGTEKVVLVASKTQGVWNALVFSQNGNVFFPVSSRVPRLRDLQAVGLPAASAGGAVADFNGDGVRDILAFPQGLFLRDGDQYKSTDLIDLTWAEPRREVRVVPFDHDKDGDLDLWVLAQSGAEVSRIARAIYNRSPLFLQGWIENYYGRDRLRQRYWRSVLYENKQDTGHLLVLRPQDLGGRANGFGQTFVSHVQLSAEGKARQTQSLFAGMDDPSRFSQTFPYMFLSIPEGGQIMSGAPLPSPVPQYSDPAVKIAE